MVKGSTDGPHTLIIIERKTARRRIDSSPVAHEPRVDPFRESGNRSTTFQDPPALNAFARYVVAPCPEIVMMLTSRFTTSTSTSTTMILITVMYPPARKTRSIAAI